MQPSVRALLRAGITTAIVDGLFSSVLVTVFYGSTFARLWQGVASVLLGPDAMNGGTRTVLIGLLMHVTVAFWWSTVFIYVVLRLPTIRAVLESRFGVFKVAAVYGPAIWVAMSFVVIPFLAHRPWPPAITFRWLVQLVGHFPFVGIPIVGSVKRAQRPSA